MAKAVKINGQWFRKRRGKWVVIPRQWLGHTVFRNKCHFYSHWPLPGRVCREQSYKRSLGREVANDTLDYFEGRHYPVCAEVNNEDQE